MLYLSSFTFPDSEQETDVRFRMRMTCYQTMYPFFLLPEKGMREIFFRPITILCGGNGSGKSTILNIIAEKLGLERVTPYNRSSFYEDYLRLCRYDTEEPIPRNSRIITSDDVFDFMLNLRAMNEGIDNRREEMLDEYYRQRNANVKVKSLADYEALRLQNAARSKTKSRFVDDEVGHNLREHSNGESAILYFRDRIEPDTLCLLDEPENSLSAENQRILASELYEAVRYCGNQLIISTHSPFLLALPGARIIDLDRNSRIAESWTELANVKALYRLFQEHRQEFE